MHYDLIVVMPIYNEAECIEVVLSSWIAELTRLNIHFLIYALNDGSTDNTETVLMRFKDSPVVKIINKKNSGHGPTILLGYRQAVGQATWIFQCDSDDEMSPKHFQLFWQKRHDKDALFGIREDRDQNIGRKVISFFSRLVVKLFFAPGVEDVNTPYRLIKSNILEKIVCHIPDITFAPNVIISGTLANSKCRIYQTHVPHQNRRTGSVSITNLKLWKSALVAFGQTIRCRPTLTL